MDRDPQSKSLKIVDRLIRYHSYTYCQNCLLLLSHLKVSKSHQLCKPWNLCFARIAMTIENSHTNGQRCPPAGGCSPASEGLCRPPQPCACPRAVLELHGPHSPKNQGIFWVEDGCPRAALSIQSKAPQHHWSPKPQASACKRPWILCWLEVDKPTLQNTMQLSTPSNRDCGGLSSRPQFLPPVLILTSSQDAVCLSSQSHHPCSLCAECLKWEAMKEWLHCHCAYAVHAVKAELLEIVLFYFLTCFYELDFKKRIILEQGQTWQIGLARVGASSYATNWVCFCTLHIFT